MPFEVVFFCVCDYLNLDDFDSGAVYKNSVLEVFQNPVKYPRWSVLQKQLTAFSRDLTRF